MLEKLINIKFLKNMNKLIMNLESVVFLKKEQQKNTFGGKDLNIGDNVLAGSCAVLITNCDGERLVWWGSLDEITAAGGNGGGRRWCCDSCSSASWINSRNIC